MTCIVGLKHNRCVYIGGDSAAVSGYVLTLTSQPKVFRNGPFVFGYTTSFRMGQIIQYQFNPPVRAKDQDPFVYMIRDFVPAIRKVLVDEKFTRVENNQEHGGVFLVAHERRLFRIDSDFQVHETQDDYDAIGSGAEFAMGSLYSTAVNTSAYHRVELALTAGAHHCTGVRAPFTILES